VSQINVLDVCSVYIVNIIRTKESIKLLFQERLVNLNNSVFFYGRSIALAVQYRARNKLMFCVKGVTLRFDGTESTVIF
jgi:hypothetical protein